MTRAALAGIVAVLISKMLPAALARASAASHEPTTGMMLLVDFGLDAIMGLGPVLIGGLVLAAIWLAAASFLPWLRGFWPSALLAAAVMTAQGLVRFGSLPWQTVAGALLGGILFAWRTSRIMPPTAEAPAVGIPAAETGAGAPAAVAQAEPFPLPEPAPPVPAQATAAWAGTESADAAAGRRAAALKIAQALTGVGLAGVGLLVLASLATGGFAGDWGLAGSVIVFVVGKFMLTVTFPAVLLALYSRRWAASWWVYAFAVPIWAVSLVYASHEGRWGERWRFAQRERAESWGHRKEAALSSAIRVAKPDLMRVRKLIREGADVNLRLDVHRTPIEGAVSYCHPEVVQVLLEAGANPNPDPAKPLLEQACRIVASGGEDAPNAAIARLLLEHGAPVDGPPSCDGALFRAVASDRLATAKVLLEHGAAVDRPSRTGRQPLAIAGSAEMVRVLLAAGANPNGNEKWSPLREAVSRDKADMVEALLRAGAKIQPVNRWDNPLLGNARSVAVVNALLAGGADGSGAPFVRLAECDQIELVRALLDAGVDPSSIGEGGKTAIHVARNPELCKLLIARGANVNAVDSRGQTPLDEAMYSPERMHILTAAGAKRSHAKTDRPGPR